MLNGRPRIGQMKAISELLSEARHRLPMPALRQGVERGQPVQRVPEQDADTGEWRDPWYPGLVITKPEGPVAVEVEDVDEDEAELEPEEELEFDLVMEEAHWIVQGAHVYLGDGHYYDDKSLKKKHKFPQVEIPAGQRHYKYFTPGDSEVKIVGIAEILGNLNSESKSDVDSTDDEKVASITAEMRSPRVIYPIQLERLEGGKILLYQGRNRLSASRAMNFPEIPVIWIEPRDQSAAFWDDGEEAGAGEAQSAAGAGAEASHPSGATATRPSAGDKRKEQEPSSEDAERAAAAGSNVEAEAKQGDKKQKPSPDEEPD